MKVEDDIWYVDTRQMHRVANSNDDIVAFTVDKNTAKYIARCPDRIRLLIRVRDKLCDTNNMTHDQLSYQQIASI